MTQNDLILASKGSFACPFCETMSCFGFTTNCSSDHNICLELYCLCLMNAVIVSRIHCFEISF